MEILKTKFDTLLLDSPESGVLHITLNRPEVRNALNTQMAKDLASVFQSIDTDSKLRAVILSGSGDKAFCAGADLKERNSMDMTAWKEQHLHFEAAIDGIESLGTPVIAAVNGVAFGGGLEIILACDFAYSIEESRFSFSEVKLGIIPGLGGMYRLKQLVGPARAKELVCSGEIFTAKEAASWGIFNSLVDPAKLLTEAVAKAKQVADCAPLAVAAAKEAIDTASGKDIASWTNDEHRLYYSLVESEDRLEGISAFNEKRTAKFSGK